MDNPTPGINPESKARIAEAALLGLLQPGASFFRVSHEDACAFLGGGSCGCRPVITLTTKSGDTWRNGGEGWQHMIGGRFGAN